MTSTNWITIAIAALLASGPTLAQVLAQPGSLSNPMAIVQFGLPGDDKFVFCRTVDCPQRSIKHLASVPQAAQRPAPLPPTVTPPPSPPLLLPPIQSIATGARSAAKVCEEAAPSHKPVAKRKPKRHIECKSPAR